MKKKIYSSFLKVTSVLAAGAVVQAVRLSKVAEDLAEQADQYIHQSYLARHTWTDYEEKRSDIQVVWDGIVYTLDIGENFLTIHVSVNMFDLKITSIEVKDVQGQYDYIEM